MVDGVALSIDVDCRREGGFGGDMSCESDSMLVVPNITSSNWWMMATLISTLPFQLSSQTTHLTCSATSFVVPDPSTHFPKNNSPRNGFRGFMRFFFPFSSLLLCCSFRVLRNHFNTNSARFSGSGSLAGATNSDGCSAQ